MDDYDILENQIVNDVRTLTKDQDTIPCFNAYHRLLVGSFRILCVRGDKKFLKLVVKTIYNNLIDEISKE